MLVNINSYFNRSISTVSKFLHIISNSRFYCMYAVIILQYNFLEPHYFDASPAPVENFDATPAPAPATI
jgi:hypothetical protein